MSHYNYSGTLIQPGAIPRTKPWYTIIEAASKFCLTITQLEKWVDDRSVRIVLDNSRDILIKAEDIELKLKYVIITDSSRVVGR